MANDVHKIKLLLLWDILCKNTDENHALNIEAFFAPKTLRYIGYKRCSTFV